MTKKKGVSWSSNSTYKLKIFSFTKPYDTKRGTKGPIARSGHRIVCNERSMFAIGGYNPNVPHLNTSSRIWERRTVFHEIWRFDFDSKQWTKLKCKNMAPELASCATVMSGNLMFLYGGTGSPFGNKINEDVSVCNLLTSDPVIEFSQIDIVGRTIPPKQYGQSIVVGGKFLYTVGGTNGFVYSMDVYRLDLQNKVWEKLTKNSDREGPPSRYRHEVVLYKDYLIILGGGTSEVAFGFQQLPAFNLKRYHWEIFDTFADDSMLHHRYPENRRCHACVQDPCEAAIVFINGGVNGEKSFRDTWRLDLRTLKWTVIPNLSLPYGIFFHAATINPEGKMLIYGGVITQNAGRTRTSDVYSSWITIPKLEHACWEAVLHYVKNGQIKVPDNIKILGLPPQYEKRLKQCL